MWVVRGWVNLDTIFVNRGGGGLLPDPLHQMVGIVEIVDDFYIPESAFFVMPIIRVVRLADFNVSPSRQSVEPFCKAKLTAVFHQLHATCGASKIRFHNAESSFSPFFRCLHLILLRCSLSLRQPLKTGRLLPPRSSVFDFPAHLSGGVLPPHRTMGVLLREVEHDHPLLLLADLAMQRQ